MQYLNVNSAWWVDISHQLTRNILHQVGEPYIIWYVMYRQSSIEVAMHLLQFIFVSDSGFRIPLAHFPTAQCPASVLYLQFWEGVMRVKRACFACVSRQRKTVEISVYICSHFQRHLNTFGHSCIIIRNIHDAFTK